jgi:hypothetical protein
MAVIVAPVMPAFYQSVSLAAPQHALASEQRVRGVGWDHQYRPASTS